MTRIWMRNLKKQLLSFNSPNKDISKISAAWVHCPTADTGVKKNSVTQIKKLDEIEDKLHSTSIYKLSVNQHRWKKNR